MSDSAQSHGAPAAAAMPPAKGLLVLGGLVVVIGAFLWITHLLGITEVWVAFLFLLYWAGLDHAQMETLPKAIVGAAVGLLIAYSLQQLPLSMGNAGLGVFLAIILVLVYFQIVGWLTLAVNMSTMLFLTVGTIPPIQAAFNFQALLMALGAGIIYFVGLVWLAMRLQKKAPAGN
jgi:branched-subunit amino acid transport protein AzlD